MSLPLPKLDGFSPMPLGIMIPFMATQSSVMAYSFGLNYEYGKRKIKSMSNEDFNKLTPQQITQMAALHSRSEIEAFMNEVPKYDSLQALVIQKMVELEAIKIRLLPELLGQVPKEFIQGFTDLYNGVRPSQNINVNVSGGTSTPSTTSSNIPPPSTTSSNNPAQPPSFTNPPPSNLPPTPPAEQPFSIQVRSWAANMDTSPETRTLSAWIKHLDSLRQTVLTFDPARHKSAIDLYLWNISTISTTLHKMTGKWY